MLESQKKIEASEEDAKKKVNILAYELLSIVKNFLDCKISIENCYIVYENNLDFMHTNE